MEISKKAELWNKLGSLNPNYLEIWEEAQKELLKKLIKDYGDRLDTLYNRIIYNELNQVLEELSNK